MKTLTNNKEPFFFNFALFFANEVSIMAKYTQRDESYKRFRL